MTGTPSDNSCTLLWTPQLRTTEMVRAENDRSLRWFRSQAASVDLLGLLLLLTVFPGVVRAAELWEHADVQSGSASPRELLLPGEEFCVSISLPPGQLLWLSGWCRPSESLVWKKEYSPFLTKSIPGSELPGQTEVPAWSECFAGEWQLQPSSAGALHHRCACPPTTHLGNQGQNAALSNQAQVGLHAHGHRQQVTRVQNFLLCLF